MVDSKCMDVGQACQLVRAWNDSFTSASAQPTTTAELADAVVQLKRYLECEAADAGPIRELEIADYLLETREGIRWVMPYVVKAESIEASKRRRALC